MDLIRDLGLDFFNTSNEFSLQGSNGCLSNDFESLVMRRLRQEEERKRLIAEMEREDREGS